MNNLKFLLLLLGSVFLFGACQNSTEKEKNTHKTENSTAMEKEIPFSIAKNYFVKKDIETVKNPKITTQKEFDQIFGMATTMSEEGKPTPIDFSKQFVIAVVLPETDIATELHAVDLIQNEEEKLIFTYQKEEDKKISHTIKPLLMVLVDNKYQGEVILNQD